MDLLARWAGGYCAARGCGPPRPAPELNGRSLWFPVGKPDQLGRYVLVDQGLEVLDRVREPFVYVEIAAPRGLLGPEVPHGWHLRARAFLMVPGSGARDADGPPPEGVAVERTFRERSVEVRVLAPGGGLAARGVIGIDGRIAVFDQVVTEPAFRRQGLGSVIMRELAAAATAASATERLLIATEEGRALYARLGWDVVTDVMSVVSLPTA